MVEIEGVMRRRRMLRMVLLLVVLLVGVACASDCPLLRLPFCLSRAGWGVVRAATGALARPLAR